LINHVLFQSAVALKQSNIGEYSNIQKTDNYGTMAHIACTMQPALVLFKT